MADDDNLEGGLTERQREVLAALLDERHMAGAARKAGLARSTLYTWLEQPEFRAADGQVRAKLFHEALDLLNAGAANAIGRLCGIMDHGNPEVRL